MSSVPLSTMRDPCAICRDPCTAEAWAVLACSHTYHRTCLAAWTARHPSCPLCRAHVQDSRTLPARKAPLVLDDSAITALFGTDDLADIVRTQDLSDTMRRRLCDTCGCRRHYAEIMYLFSVYQNLDEQFILDYYDDLHIPELHARRAELAVSHELLHMLAADSR